MDTDELRQFIVQKRELLARETFSRRAFNRCENMSDEMKNRYVEYLIERLENAELDNRAMKLVLEDLTKELSRSNRMLEKLNELQSLLEEERESRKSLERENIKLKEQLKSARKNRFGSKRQSVKKGDSGSDDDPVDREKEKDGFDGTDESLDTRSVAESETQESRPSSPNPGDLSNRPDTYRTMGVNGTAGGENSILSERVTETGNPLTLDEIITAVEKEDLLCIEIVEEIGQKLGRQIAGLISIFNPELVIIGGALSLTGDYIIQPIKTAVRKYSLNLVNKDAVIIPSKLKSKAGVVGACMLARSRVFES